MTSFRFSGIALALCFGFLNLHFSFGQDVSEAPASVSVETSVASAAIDPYTVRVEVIGEPYPDPVRIASSAGEIRMGVVVLDKKGRQITDLTADDFEIYQDGQKCEITSGVYIDYLTGDALPHSMKLELENGSYIRTSRSDHWDLNDYQSSSGYNNYHPLAEDISWLALHQQQGDLAVITQTDYRKSVMDVFLSNKNELIHNYINWQAERSHVSYFLLNTQGQEVILSEVLESEIFGTYLPDLSSYIIKAPRIDVSGLQSYFINGIGFTTKSSPYSSSRYNIDKKNGKDISGYYRISYIPPLDMANGHKTFSHRVTVKVKRKNVTVHMRAGFFGDPSRAGKGITYAYRVNKEDYKVNMFSGYTKDAKAGVLLRSWIHIDAEALNMTETENGARVEFSTLFLIRSSSKKSYPKEDVYRNKYSFDISHENIEWIKKHGIRFTMVFPVKKANMYIVNLTVQDEELNIVGNATYLVHQVPDLKKKGLALSSVFMLASAADLKLIFSDATEEIKNKGKLTAIFQDDDTRSPAIESLMPGDSFHALAMLYNADAKAIARSEIESQYILMYSEFENPESREYRRGELIPVTVDGDVNPADGIPLLYKITLEPDMPPGNYRLEIHVTDKKNAKNKIREDYQMYSYFPIKEGDCAGQLFFFIRDTQSSKP